MASFHLGTDQNLRMGGVVFDTQGPSKTIIPPKIVDQIWVPKFDTPIPKFSVLKWIPSPLGPLEKLHP